MVLITHIKICFYTANLIKKQLETLCLASKTSKISTTTYNVEKNVGFVFIIICKIVIGYL